MEDVWEAMVSRHIQHLPQAVDMYVGSRMITGGFLGIVYEC